MKKIDYWDQNVPVPAPGGESMIETLSRLAHVDPHELVPGKEHLLDSMVIVSYDVLTVRPIADILETIDDRAALIFALGIKRVCFLFLDALNNVKLVDYIISETDGIGIKVVDLFDPTANQKLEKDACVYLIPKL